MNSIFLLLIVVVAVIAILAVLKSISRRGIGEEVWPFYAKKSLSRHAAQRIARQRPTWQLRDRRVYLRRNFER